MVEAELSSTRSDNVLTVALSLGASIAAFVLFYIIYSCASPSDIVLGRRLILHGRVCVFILSFLFCVQLYYDSVEASHSIYGTALEWPFFHVARPVLGLLYCLISFYLNTHFFIRWITIVLAVLFGTCSIGISSVLEFYISCIENGLCSDEKMIHSVGSMRVNRIVQFMSLSFLMQLFICTICVALIMGLFKAHYPVSLFSLSQSLEEITTRAKVSSKKPKRF